MSLTGTITAYPLLHSAQQLADAGRLEEAAQHLMRHLRLHPAEFQGLAKLGDVAMQLGALVQAEHFLRSAIAAGSRNGETYRLLASVLNQQERGEEALALLDALEDDAQDPVLLSQRARIFDRMGRSKEAQNILRRLTETHGDSTFHWVALGASLRATGDVDGAIRAYRRAIEIDDECGDAWWGLASIKNKILTDGDINHMQRMLGVAIDVRNSAPLHFAFARAMHDRGRYDEAFRHYDEGNRQRAAEIGYDADELTNEVAEVERNVGQAFIDSLDQEPVGEDIPVFIISLPRSGSTLLEQMLGSHPKIEPVGELPYIPAILRGVMEIATRKGQITVPQLIASMSPEQAIALGQDYLRRAALHRKTHRRYFIDKLPHNWCNVLFIRRILPQAKFLDIRRDPMDCCFSNFTQSFSSAHASSFTLKDIARSYIDYTRLTAHLDRVAPNLLHHICYEALVDEPETVLRSVLAHLGLEWDTAVLEFHKLERTVRTLSSEQVRRPLNRDGMEVWKPYAPWLAPLREALEPLAP